MLNDNNCNSCHVAGYNFVGKKNRKHSKRGGVSIIIRDNITFVGRDDLSIFLECEFESDFIKVSDRQSNMVDGERYRIPGTNGTHAIICYETIVTEILNENKDAVIGTDQNINLLNITQTYSRSSLDTFYSAGMVPTISRPTRVVHTSTTLIDNLYVKPNKCI